MNTVLIVGATGVVGEAALTHFAAIEGWHPIAISRRTPDPPCGGKFRFLPLDLTDAKACQQACADLVDVSHVVYAAVAEKPGLVSGWRDREQMQLNLAMLQNLMEPLCAKAPALRHVSLLQGTKAYGAHAGHIAPLPAREQAPRVQHENFYWLQEDYIREKAIQRGFSWTIFRPQVIVGGARGVAMNPLLPLVAYAAIRREEGKRFSYPGGEIQLSELVDASLLAEACEWAATTPQAHNEIFNITNGDIFAWREAWPTLADILNVEAGPDEPMLLSDYLLQRSDVWEHIATRYQLQSANLAEFLGESHHYLDILLRKSAKSIERPSLLSTIKIRQAGFAGCRDSLDSVRYWIGVMEDRRLIPSR